MLKYGNDKPDLRIPFEISDVTDIFRGSDFSIFAKNIEKGAVVRAVPGPKCGSRAIADRMNSWAQGEGAPGMGGGTWGSAPPLPTGGGLACWASPAWDPVPGRRSFSGARPPAAAHWRSGSPA